MGQVARRRSSTPTRTTASDRLNHWRRNDSLEPKKRGQQRDNSGELLPAEAERRWFRVGDDEDTFSWAGPSCDG